VKVALAHDWLTGFRGGERVLEAMCELYPNSPLYTLIYSPGSTSASIENREIIASSINTWPEIEKHYRKLLPLYPWALKSLKFDQRASHYDLLLSSSHCVIKGISRSSIPHISYIHSPMRYMYDQFPIYFGKESKASPLEKLVAMGIRPFLKSWDYLSNDYVTTLVANSSFVGKRIEEFYRRECQVIHPFVDLKEITTFMDQHQEKLLHKQSGPYFVMVTALAPNKRVDLAIKACAELNVPLKIIGTGQCEKELKALRPPQVEFLGSIPRHELFHYLRNARALIFPGVEDFGITPLEALALNIPIVALGYGGVMDYLHEGVAEFFYESTQDSLKKALEVFMEREKAMEFSSLPLESKKITSQFTKEIFQQKIKKIIATTMS
jgi:glycosyltransferase involved in cell wall biosynthesis